MTRTAKRTPLTDLLSRLGACREAQAWASAFDGSPESAWKECHRGDWLLWLMGQFSGEPESDERKRLVLCACECARLAPQIKRDDWEKARLRCLDVTERWSRSEEGVTIQQVRESRYAAGAAYAADAAAAYADAAAAYAADAAYSAAYAAADADARKRVLSQAADIVRKHYPWEDVRGYLVFDAAYPANQRNKG